MIWLNLGDSYGKGGNTAMTGGKHDADRGKKMGFGALPPTDTGLHSKNLLGIPWRVAFALQEAGWYLRQDIIWAKPNPMPESVTDRCTKAHEYVFLLAKNARYFWDADAMKEAAIYAGANSSRKNAGNIEQQQDHQHFRTRPSGRTCGYPDHRNRRSGRNWLADDGVLCWAAS